MSRFYTRTVVEHFRRPRNQRTLPDPDGTGRAINRACSDIVRVQIKVESHRLVDVAFRAQGCVACVAAASVTTEFARSLTLEEAERVDADAVVEALGGLPEGKRECSLIAPQALRLAIADHRERSAR
jgi:nitrogen fixation NifU-like protein